MNKELSTEELLIRVTQRDLPAFSELYDRFAPRVLGLVAHILPPSEAEQVLQEIFLRLWSEGRIVRDAGGSIVAWLVVSARVAALDRLRNLAPTAPSASLKNHKGDIEKAPSSSRQKAGKATGKSSAGKPEMLKSVPADGASSPARASFPLAWLPLPKEIALIDDRLVLLHKTIDQLPKPQRQALELAVYGGRSEAEIAVEVGKGLPDQLVGRIQQCHLRVRDRHLGHTANDLPGDGG